MATLADALRGYVPPTESPMSDVVTNYASNVLPQAKANLLRQAGNVQNAIEVTPDLHLQVKDPQAFNEFMNEIPNLANMVAYHGTPHNIQGAFDISKVGTGEGNQSFGHGMYFAENPAVAQQYQAALAKTKYKVGDRELTGNEAWAAQFLHDFQDDALPKRVDVNTALKKAQELLKHGETQQEILNNIKALDKSGLTVENGNLYKVDIPDKHIPLMLDWDKPISKQTELVKNVAQELLPNIQKTNPSFNLDKATGADFYRAYTRHKGNYPDFASEALLEKGIKGIKYKDEKSRYDWVYSGDPAYTHAGNSFKESGYTPQQALEGMKQTYKNASSEELQNAINDVYGIQPPKTHNFVVFEPSTVQILEKNGKPTRKDIIEQQVNKVLE